MLVVTDGRGGNAEVVQQLLRQPRIFTGDAVDALQDPQRAQGDVLKIADRRRDQVESRIERRIVRLASVLIF